jgi:hypothetical protein
MVQDSHNGFSLPKVRKTLIAEDAHNEVTIYLGFEGQPVLRQHTWVTCVGLDEALQLMNRHQIGWPVLTIAASALQDGEDRSGEYRFWDVGHGDDSLIVKR